MSVELITGRSGRDHISSNHARMLNAGIYGADHYLLKQLSWDTPPSMQDANTVIIPPRVLMMNGAQVVIDQAETVTIQSGSQGQKRSDIIVCRYSLDTSTGYETATLQAIKGTPAGGTPKDPAIETDSIIGGAIVHDMPICRINLDGITITGVDDLEQVLTPVGDSLTRIEFERTLDYGLDQFSADGVVSNGVALINVKWVNAGTFTVNAWKVVTICRMVGWATTRDVNTVATENYIPEYAGYGMFTIVGGAINYTSIYTHNVPENTWHYANIITPVKRV